eukprot:4507385-Amphidinium_carterae.1
MPINGWHTLALARKIPMPCQLHYTVVDQSFRAKEAKACPRESTETRNTSHKVNITNRSLWAILRNTRATKYLYDNFNAVSIN